MIKRLGRAAGGWGGAQGDQLPTKRTAWGEGAERGQGPRITQVPLLGVRVPGTQKFLSRTHFSGARIAWAPWQKIRQRDSGLQTGSLEYLLSTLFYLLSQDVSKMPGRDPPTIISWGTGGKDSLCNGVEGSMPPDHFCRELALVDSTEFILSVPAS